MPLACRRDKYGEMATAFKGPAWEQNMTMCTEYSAGRSHGGNGDMIYQIMKDLSPVTVTANTYGALTMCEAPHVHFPA